MLDMLIEEAEARLDMLPDIFADMGGWGHIQNSEAVKEACRSFAITHLQECPGLSVSDLQSGLHYYREGYLQGIVDCRK